MTGSEQQGLWSGVLGHWHQEQRVEVSAMDSMGIYKQLSLSIHEHGKPPIYL